MYTYRVVVKYDADFSEVIFVSGANRNCALISLEEMIEEHFIIVDMYEIDYPLYEEE